MVTAPQGTDRATTYAGTLRKVTDSTTPSRQWTVAVTRPDGTSIVTTVDGDGATRPDSTAQAPSAIVPWPHAVEYPSLCQNSTPRSAPSSSGGTRKQPYMSACPRGSWQSSRRTSSTAATPGARERRSVTVAPGISGTPEVTIRNGSPAVW